MTHFAIIDRPVAQVSASNVALVINVFDTARPATDFKDLTAQLVVDGTGLARSGMYYDGTTFSAAPLTLATAQVLKQAQLDAFFDSRFDLASFIRSGTLTTITGTQVGTFLATITNNYRTIRANIAAAATIAAVTAIDVTAGWPSNP